MTGLDEVGGIVGDSTGSSSLIDCHATNTVCARRNNAGGLMGRNMGGGITMLRNWFRYWNRELCWRSCGKCHSWFN
ncbi:MAG: hypothetical protein GXY07_19895 [Candidatus Hydrogenedentes bacterium]|nr:hypothetical protein [Candidatus Hydrogenedentota bacterium]